MKDPLTNLGSSEAQVQAEFYHRMRLMDVPVYLGEPLPSKVHRSGVFVADALVGKPLACAVEFKRADRRKPKPSSRQARSYDGCGLPWRYCCGIEEIEETIDWCLEQCQRRNAA